MENEKMEELMKETMGFGLKELSDAFDEFHKDGDGNKLEGVIS